MGVVCVERVLFFFIVFLGSWWVCRFWGYGDSCKGLVFLLRFVFIVREEVLCSFWRGRSCSLDGVLVFRFIEKLYRSA